MKRSAKADQFDDMRNFCKENWQMLRSGKLTHHIANACANQMMVFLRSHHTQIMIARAAAKLANSNGSQSKRIKRDVIRLPA
jgi:hypothetical protein